ncbi:Glucose / Sorbosone dehydrogenase domain protein [Synechococcus sp. PCC 7335]|uniref:PQQ-dependent sugar dehydrogenase n=1 Tax=Synechococcus sp. (strain ATCC 29403 / PCC 7335) TaxID=91464 RepID=UPI00017EE483|nr:PQQ-dependent sugar dehydrogenase [Synechococcus sp. PCC 7335]EDX86878.1 Glucose / Sorbosone dehydrogenase domain protein [Synechococcus sp. PCC 7335]
MASARNYFFYLANLARALAAGWMIAGCASPATSPLEQTAPLDQVDQTSSAIAPDESADASVSGSAELLAQSPTPQLVTLVDSLEHPWGIAWLPDGTTLLTERPGRLRIFKDGVLDPTPVDGLPTVFNRGQGGLMDVSVHPQFAENQWVYFTYADGTGSANRMRVARARFDGRTLSEWQVIFETNRTKEGTQHFGSRLAWLPDNTLLVSIGDGGNPPVSLEGELIRNQAQNLSSHLGSIVRINDDGSIPADNPFVDTSEADPAIWSYGHRNIQGVAIDSATGQVWATEHGSRGGDELNQVAPGENYGWPVVTHSREYSGGEISSERSRPGMIDPLVVWTPAIAPSGLMVYRGELVPQWQGDLFAGGLVSQSVQHIQLDDSGTILGQTPIDIGQRVRDVAQGPDGQIYVLTDEPSGRLIRLEPS